MKLTSATIHTSLAEPGGPGPISNEAIAELLASEAENASGHLQRALRRAARSAFLWPVEAADLARAGHSLTELVSVGPYLERWLRTWLEDPPALLETPRIRRPFLSVSQARRILSGKPEWRQMLRGDLQMHSTWSDGADSIAEMAEAAEARGYDYIAITDHSKGLRIAGGVNEAQLSEQAEEIVQVNRALNDSGRRVRVLRSLELNLSVEGCGDMDSAALGQLDIVVGAFHSQLRKTEDQTERYLAALRNVDIQILGHPRGRIYNYRLGLTADWPRVFEEAARLDKALEIDSYPDRQDLDSELLLLARDAGVRLAIDTDAHRGSQFEFVELGLASALEAGILAERIVNFMPREQLLAWVSQVRSKAGLLS